MRAASRRLVAVVSAAVLVLVALVGAPPEQAMAANTETFREQLKTNAVAGQSADGGGINVNGDIVTIGNNLMSCVPNQNTAYNTKCRQQWDGSNGYNNDFDMRYLDVDSDAATFNSSMASLALPDGANVLWAGLYWGSRGGSATATHATHSMSFKTPGSTAYTKVTADRYMGPNTTSSNAYQGMVDVTGMLRARQSSAGTANGDYWGANVTGTQGYDQYAGWSLVVAYEAPGLPLRNLTLFDGFNVVDQGKPISVTVSGFLAPKTGPVDASLTMVAYEGDAYLRVCQVFGVSG